MFGKKRKTKEKKIKTKPLQSFFIHPNRNIDKWKVFLDGAVFQEKSKEVEKIRRMPHCPGTQRRKVKKKRKFSDRSLMERCFDKNKKEIIVCICEQDI